MSRLTSSFTCQLIYIIITTLIIHHSFTPGSKPTFSTNPSHLRLLLPTGLPSWQCDRPDLSCSSFYFLFHILIFCLFRAVDEAGYPSTFYCTLNTHYRIVSYRIGLSKRLNQKAKCLQSGQAEAEKYRAHTWELPAPKRWWRADRSVLAVAGRSCAVQDDIHQNDYDPAPVTSLCFYQKRIWIYHNAKPCK